MRSFGVQPIVVVKHAKGKSINDPSTYSALETINVEILEYDIEDEYAKFNGLYLRNVTWYRGRWWRVYSKHTLGRQIPFELYFPDSEHEIDTPVDNHKPSRKLVSLFAPEYRRDKTEFPRGRNPDSQVLRTGPRHRAVD